MDFQQFLDMLSGRPTRAGHGDIQRGQQNLESRESQQQRAQGRDEYMARVNAPPPPPNNDLYAILQRNLANPEVTPDHLALQQAGQEWVGAAEDIRNNAASDYAAMQMQPPLQTLGSQNVQMSAFQPEVPTAAAAPATQTKNIEFLGLPPPTPQPPRPGPMPPMEQIGKPTPFVPDFNRIPPMGPSVAGMQDFIPPEVLLASRQPQPIAPLRPIPRGTPAVIGPGGAGAPLPFAPTIRVGESAPAEAQAPIPAIQRNGWIGPPQGAAPLQPRPAPAPAEPQVSAEELNRQELNRLLASFDQPPQSQPPPTASAPSPGEPRTVADVSNQIKPQAPPKLNEAMPEILKEQLLQEAIRLTRARQGAA